MAKRKKFYVDFECWIISAKSKFEAETKAINRIRNDEIPEICEVSVCEIDEECR